MAVIIITAQRNAARVAPSKGKLMCVTIDSAGGFAACGHTGAAAGAVGFTNDSLMFPPAKVEYGAIGQRIASSQPAIVVTHLPAGLAPGVLLAARSAGYRGPMLLHNVAFNEATLVKAMETAGNFENTYVFSRYVLAHDPLPEVAEIGRAAGGIDSVDMGTEAVMDGGKRVHERAGEIRDVSNDIGLLGLGSGHPNAGAQEQGNPGHNCDAL